jgi:hypothetical protein
LILEYNAAPQLVQLILAVLKQDFALCEESMKFGTEVENDKPNILRPGATLNSHPELSNRSSYSLYSTSHISLVFVDRCIEIAILM